MSNDYVTPVNHSTMGGIANVTAGTVGGALKKGLLTTALWVAGMTVAGAVVLPLMFTGAPIIAAIAGTVVGAGFGVGTSWLPGGLATIIGGITGGSRASERVDAERFAATQAQLQIEAIRAQSMAQAAGASKYNFPPQGSAMNAAPSQINASTAQGFGTLDNQRQMQVG